MSEKLSRKWWCDHIRVRAYDTTKGIFIVCLNCMAGLFERVCQAQEPAGWTASLFLQKQHLISRCVILFSPFVTLLHYLSSFFFQVPWYATKVSVGVWSRSASFFNCLLFHLSPSYSLFVSQFHCFCSARPMSLIHPFSAPFTSSSGFLLSILYIYHCVCIIFVFIYTFVVFTERRRWPTWLGVNWFLIYSSV